MERERTNQSSSSKYRNFNNVGDDEQCYVCDITLRKLNTCFLNKKNQMMIQSLPWYLNNGWDLFRFCKNHKSF